MKPLCNASRSIAAALLLLCWTGLAIAGQTGKLAGHITDGQNREPLPGASVVVEGTKLGAAADMDGYYVINNVPPGTYTLVYSLIGYQKTVVKNVQVRIDLTTTTDVKLNSSAIDVSEVVITAERPLVQKDLTSTSVTVSNEEMRMMPVENVDQVINLQAGVFGGHFRGGRTDEVLYLVDGVSVTDPYSNGRGVTIENSAVQQMEVISGAFNAEYGQAMSGVVNIVTQDGSPTFHGSLSGYVGDYFTSHTDVFENLNTHKNPRTRNVEATVSGPTFLDGLTFFAGGRYLMQDGNLYGKRVYNTTDTGATSGTGDGREVPMNPSKRNSANGKVSYTVGATKFSLSGTYERGWNKYYNPAYRWTPDAVSNHYHTGEMIGFQVNSGLSKSSFLSFKYSYNWFDYRGGLFQDPYDPRYVDPTIGSRSGLTFNIGGNEGDRYERNTRTHLMQMSLTSQVTKEHKITSGLELQLHRLYSHGYSVRNVSSVSGEFALGYARLGALGNQAYLKNPYQAAAYIQDKIEYDIMIINAGVRFDMFDASAYYPADLKNPNGNTDFAGAGLMRKASRKYQVSPRLGVSFPITDQGIIHFSYGHFFQMPGFDNLFTNPDYLVASDNRGTIGNPDLEAQRTVSYEIGLQQVLFENYSLDLSVYYRDIRNYLGMEVIDTYEGRTYFRYINRDYANVRGAVLSVERRLADYFSLKADYTFQIAEGNSSDPQTVRQNSATDPPTETPKSVQPLDWDQRHTLYLTAMVGKPGDWTASLIFQFGSGWPYTESIQISNGLRFLNGGTKPSTFNVDFRADKSFTLEGFRVNAFLWVYNLLDIKNEYGVNARTGRANLWTEEDIIAAGQVQGLNTKEQYINDPTSFSSPREVRLGFSVEF